MPPTRQLIVPAVLLRRTSRPASSIASCTQKRLCGCHSAVGAAAAVRQSQERQQLRALAPRRWYSAGGGDNVVPGSRIWSFDEIKKLVEGTNKSSKHVVIVDVREPGELQSTGKIPGAINIPITSAVQSFHIPEVDFEDMYGFERPSRDRTLLFYCKAGVRAKSAAGLAKHAGWKSVGEYPGSWLDWEANGGPVERVKATEGFDQN